MRESVIVAGFKVKNGQIYVILNIFEEGSDKAALDEVLLDEMADRGYVCDNFSVISPLDVVMLEGRYFNNLEELKMEIENARKRDNIVLLSELRTDNVKKIQFGE